MVAHAMTQVWRDRCAGYAAIESKAMWQLSLVTTAAYIQLASYLETVWQLGAIHQGAFPVVDCCSMLAGQVIQLGVVQHAVS